MRRLKGTTEGTSEDTTTPTRWRRWGGLAAVVLVASLAATFMLATSGSAVVVTTTSGDSNHVSFTLEGCRNDGSITLPINNEFICPDSAYTTGNLGKGWNELDLVPFRVTTKAGSQADATTDYTVAFALDNVNSGKTGYDIISAPTVNASSDASCSVSSTVQQETSPPTSIYRLITIHQAQGSTCVFDFYGRLALGSHLYPGSSLHANLFNQSLNESGIGSKEVSIPVNEILPQSISKDMTASQDSAHTWGVVKSAPATLGFGNTCDPSNRSKPVSITVTWTKSAATPDGDITVTTNIFATNPASREVTADVTDVIYDGTTQTTQSVPITGTNPTSSGDTDVPANTTLLILTHTITVASGQSSFNDVATATYTDKVTGLPIPGTTQATKSALVQTAAVSNDTATIQDVENITGAHFSFSADSFSPLAAGSFSLYTAGTPTTGPVTWNSVSQSGNGSVTFAKTVYLSEASTTNGTLSDTATITGSDGFTANSSASVTLQPSAQVSLKIKKTIPNVLSGGETQSFTFHVFNSANTEVASPTLNFAAGDTSKETTIGNLAPGSYTVKEDTATGWAPATDQTVDLTLPTCSGEADFNNTLNPANAKAVKVTQPAGYVSGWEMILSGPGTPTGGEKVNTDSSGNALFATQLQEGSYTITETQKSGWQAAPGSPSGECSFTVNYPANAGHLYTCTFTNRELAKIIVKKVTNPTPDPTTTSFSFTAGGGLSPSSFSIGDGGSQSFSGLSPGSGYNVAETVPTGWDLTSSTCDDDSLITNIVLSPGETVTCTFTNRLRGSIVIKKVTNPNPDPTSTSFSFTAGGGLSPSSFSLVNGGTQTYSNVVPGNGYSAAETVPAGWDLTSATCDDGSPVTNISVSPGETVTCTFTNRLRGKAKVTKTFSGLAPSGTQSVTFQLRQGASALLAGSTLESQTANAGNGGILNFTTTLTPGSTYQLCEVLGPLGPGWTTTLGPPLYSVYNPSGDNSTVCTDFTVTAGQTKTFSIDNKPPPGGLAFTIGYWKNWSSCTGGGQKPVLDQTLLKMAQNGTPETLGLLVLNPVTQSASTVCRNAVAILGKSTLTGRKMSSDPLFNMAAQLLGADLNVAAGSGGCAASATAMNQAHALLTSYSFDGNTYTPKLTNADATLANSLATSLDKYNNNKLC